MTRVIWVPSSAALRTMYGQIPEREEGGAQGMRHGECPCYCSRCECWCECTDCRCANDRATGLLEALALAWRAS